jgi:hypothetical protein
MLSRNRGCLDKNNSTISRAVVVVSSIIVPTISVAMPVIISAVALSPMPNTVVAVPGVTRWSNNNKDNQS